jgi:hypothetical protein
MYLCGYRGDISGFLVGNSWGDGWINGPIFPDDMPHGSFWAKFSDIDRVLRQGDSYIVAGFEGLVKLPELPPDFWLI